MDLHCAQLMEVGVSHDDLTDTSDSVEDTGSSTLNFYFGSQSEVEFLLSSDRHSGIRSWSWRLFLEASLLQVGVRETPTAAPSVRGRAGTTPTHHSALHMWTDVHTQQTQLI